MATLRSHLSALKLFKFSCASFHPDDLLECLNEIVKRIVIIVIKSLFVERESCNCFQIVGLVKIVLQNSSFFLCFRTKCNVYKIAGLHNPFLEYFHKFLHSFASEKPLCKQVLINDPDAIDIYYLFKHFGPSVNAVS